MLRLKKEQTCETFEKVSHVQTFAFKKMRASPFEYSDYEKAACNPHAARVRRSRPNVKGFAQLIFGIFNSGLGGQPRCSNAADVMNID